MKRTTTSMSTTPRSLRRLLAAAGALAMVVTAAAAGDPAAARDSRTDLALARAATARYHLVENALAAGYVPTGHCVTVPELGAMGEHYVNPQLAASGTFDPTQPHMLLYVPSPGGLRLVGVEWSAIDGDQNLATDDDRPSILGRPFDGPMPGHEPGQPVHYDLHVWLWSYNPAGMFAPFNPRLSC